MDFLRFLPQFWIQNRPTSKAWDKALGVALTRYGVTGVTRHEATVGPFTVWTSNYPYSFGYNRADPFEALPSCWTRMRLRRAILRWQADRYEEQMKCS